jgi:hypothetical protein
MALAIQFQSMVEQGAIRNYAELAVLGHVTRPRLSQEALPFLQRQAAPRQSR